ncbi:hypothetical protein ACFL5M_00740 [Candidatus Neomarinimicrobiota bacterium]
MNDDPSMWKPLERLTDSESLDPEQVSVDGRFVLSAHYDLVMPGTYQVEPATGGRAWSEPVLVLVVSVGHPDWSSSQGRALYYGLSRSFFTAGLDPNASDRAKLMAAVLPILKADIERLGSADAPDSLPKTRFV